MNKTGLNLEIIGKDGNAFNILAIASKTLKRNGMSSLVEEFITEATSGDYDHLLMTCMEWFNVTGDEEIEIDDFEVDLDAQELLLCEVCGDSTDGTGTMCDDCFDSEMVE